MTDVPGNAPLTKMKKKKIFPALLLSTSWWLLLQSAWLRQPKSIPGYQRINLLSIGVFQLSLLNKDPSNSKVMITWRSRIWSHWFKVWNGAKHLAQRTWTTILEGNRCFRVYHKFRKSGQVWSKQWEKRIMEEAFSDRKGNNMKMWKLTAMKSSLAAVSCKMTYCFAVFFCYRVVLTTRTPPRS